jgi:DNA repair protein RecO (recombination protein O)
MLHDTKGIVFHSIKYSESSVIVKIYTELFGIQSYLFKGVRNSRSKIKPGLFQSLSLLDLVVYHREKQSLQQVKEIRLAFPYQAIPFDIRKSSIALFINELVYKSIREEEANPDLFAFLWQTCLTLDETGENVSWFHIRFAIQLMHHLGIFPQNNHSSLLPVFNLREGLFQASIPGHPHYLDPDNSALFSEMLKIAAESHIPHPASRITDPESRIPNPASHIPHPASRLPHHPRNQLLETILLYYRLHLPGFRELQSHHILHEVLS